VDEVRNLNNTERFSSYRAVSTFRFCYKIQSVNAVCANNLCLFRDPCKTQKYTLWAECRILKDYSNR